MFNPEFILHIETAENDGTQQTKVNANGIISGMGKIVLLAKVLETLDLPRYMVDLAVKLYDHREEIPETRINLNAFQMNDD